MKKLMFVLVIGLMVSMFGCDDTEKDTTPPDTTEVTPPVEPPVEPPVIYPDPEYKKFMYVIYTNDTRGTAHSRHCSVFSMTYLYLQQYITWTRSVDDLYQYEYEWVEMITCDYTYPKQYLSVTILPSAWDGGGVPSNYTLVVEIWKITGDDSVLFLSGSCGTGNPGHSCTVTLQEE